MEGKLLSEFSVPHNKMEADSRLLFSARTKLAAERAFRTLHPDATIVRPSLVFGPGDQFFAVSTCRGTPYLVLQCS